MNLPDWLDAERGRLTAMAAHFDVTPAAITQWRTVGVPVTRMRAVVEFTSGAVSYEEMVAQREERHRASASELTPEGAQRAAA